MGILSEHVGLRIYVILLIEAMSNKARSVLKGLAVVLVLLAVAMQLGWVIVPSISVYKFFIYFP